MDSKRVVVVDDSEIVLAMASAALEEAGYQVRTLLQWEELASGSMMHP